MKATAMLEKKMDSPAHARETVIQFAEGLIGFSDCKNFVLMENDDIAPFRRLQSMDRPEVGFLVLDPSLVVSGYHSSIPKREWESLELSSPAAGITLAICIIGPSSGESTGNLQAPLIINYEKMVGKQIILTDTLLASRHPLL
jgi:flagellar assembly factor FliW